MSPARSGACHAFLNYQSLALTPFELLKLLLKSRFKKRVSQAGQRRTAACGIIISMRRMMKVAEETGDDCRLECEQMGGEAAAQQNEPHCNCANGDLDWKCFHNRKMLHVCPLIYAAMSDRHSSSVAVEMQAYLEPSMIGQNMPQKNSVELIFRELGYQVKVAIPSSKKCPCAPPYNTTEYHMKEILKGVTGVIKPGRLTCILGASGAGKTSLLNILSGSLVSGTLSGQLVRTGVLLVNPMLPLLIFH